MIQQTFYAFILLATCIHNIAGTNNGKNSDDCTIQQSIVRCEHSIPVVVPRNVSRVIIRDYLQETLNDGTFAHESWFTVGVLDITVNHKVDFGLNEKDRFPYNLQNLGIHSPRFQFPNIAAAVFEGLPRLQTLNLSSCYRLNSSSVVTMLNPFRKIHTLILDQVAISGERLFVFDDTFIKAISMKKVRRLSMSGCNLMIKGQFHVPYPQLVLYDLDLSNTSIVKQGYTSFAEILNRLRFLHLRILDLSYLLNRFFELDYRYIDALNLEHTCSEHNVLFKLFIRMEHLKLNNIFSKSFEANNSFINLSQCKIQLKSLQMRSNQIRFLNVSILWPNEINLIEFDLSSNDLEYLSLSFWGTLTSLEVINLSNNKLYRMEPFREFQYLFNKHRKLKHLDLSKNHLKVLPFKMFSYNSDLMVLDLSYNEISTVNFELRYLVKLLFLDLRNNDIHYIQSVDLSRLKVFVTQSSVDVKINVENNPLTCKCESSPFIKWIHAYMIKTENQSLICIFNNKAEVITSSLIKEAEFSCIRTKIIISSITTVVVIIFFVSAISGIRFYKNRQQKRKRKKGYFLKDFKLGNLQEKYLCFVSYSSDDDEAEIKQIIRLVKQSLQELVGTDNEVLCVSDEHFTLGFPIVNEMLRCIVGSCVGIFYVTNNFCESHWCQMELRETYDLNKPIILIFKERIDERNMPPLLLKIFKKFTRAKIIVGEDKQIQIIPDIKQISNSILRLASSRYDEDVEKK